MRAAKGQLAIATIELLILAVLAWAVYQTTAVYHNKLDRLTLTLVLLFAVPPLVGLYASIAELWNIRVDQRERNER
jgi:hypothetical protein